MSQIDGSGGPAGASPTLIGETCVMRWRRLTRGSPAVDVHPDSTGAELFAYVVRGEVELTSGSSTRRVAAGNLIVIPAATRHVHCGPSATATSDSSSSSPRDVDLGWLIRREPRAEPSVSIRCAACALTSLVTRSSSRRSPSRDRCRASPPERS